MIITTATAPAEWSAQSHLARTTVTQVTRRGRLFGHVHECESEDYSIAWPVVGAPRVFSGSGHKDRAWSSLLPSPLPSTLKWDLQDEGSKHLCPHF